MLGQGVISPVLPLYAQSFGVGLTAVGFSLSAFALARVVINTPLGVVADRRGRRPLLVGGPLVVAVGMLGSAMAPNIVVLTLWRFVSGIGSAMYMTAAMIYLADIAAPEMRARYIGTNQAAIQLGVSIGPAVGGLVADRFGLRAPFFLVAVSATLAGLYALTRLGETRPDVPSGRETPRGGWRPVVRSRPFLSVALVALAIFFTRGTTQLTLIPIQGSTSLGMKPGEIGLLLSGMATVHLILVTPAGWIADRWGRRIAIIPSLAATAVALWLFARAGDLGSFLLAAAVLSVATSMAGPAPAAFAADAVPAEARGIAFGLYRTAADLGLFIGPPLLGAVVDRAGFGAAYLVNAGLVVVAGLVFVTWGRSSGPG